MPKTSKGWTIDDAPDFTPAQWAKIKQLVKDGKTDEAQKLMDEILKAKEAK